VTELEVERVGHAVAAIQEPKLMEHLKKRNIAIESCPTSNVRTQVVNAIKNHPIRVFHDLGLAVTVNTDDPSMFGTDMNNEYLQLHHQLGFSLQELFNLGLDAVNSSFLPEESKSRLCRSFMKTYDRIMAENSV
jgi:adenosine deaminase